MTTNQKIVIGSTIILGMTFLFLFIVTNISNNNITHKDNSDIVGPSSNSTLSFNDLNSENPTIMEPTSYQSSFEYEKREIANFVLYEDFPLKTQLPVLDLKLVNVPDNAWMKLISDEEIHPDHPSGMTLRMMGVIKPFVPTPFNNTIFIIGPKGQDGLPTIASANIVKNSIMTEISIVGDSLPIKFKNEIFTGKDSKFFYIFGIVYDKNIASYLSAHEMNSSSLNVNIEPIGILSNGTLLNFPEWLVVNTIKVPLSLKQNQPDYYALQISTSNAPLGTYEIALRETINKKIFVETITLIIDT